MKSFLFFYFFIINGTFASTALNLVTPLVNKMKIDQPVQTQIELNGNFLKVSFDVKSEEINAKPVFKSGEYPFQFDVVELFLSVGKKTYPYYEFQVSPFDQTFVVKIPAIKKFVNNFKVDWTHSAQLTPHGWSAVVTIDLFKLGWDGDISKVRGNLYAITGKSPNRHFWSLSLPKMKKANFHSPQYFKNLVK